MNQHLSIAAYVPSSLIQLGIRTLLQTRQDIVITAVIEQHTDLITLCSQQQPDLVLFLTAPDEKEHIELVAKFYQRTTTPILILSLAYHQSHCCQLLELGIQGYFLIGHDDQLFFDAIHTVGAGGRWFSPVVTAQLFRSTNSARRALPDLSERETEVLQLMVQGLNNYKISQLLHVTERTVRFHIRSICDKFHFATRSEVIVWALKQGLYT